MTSASPALDFDTPWGIMYVHSPMVGDVDTPVTDLHGQKGSA
jgi:hypothetical protein